MKLLFGVIAVVELGLLFGQAQDHQALAEEAEDVTLGDYVKKSKIFPPPLSICYNGYKGNYRTLFWFHKLGSINL